MPTIPLSLKGCEGAKTVRHPLLPCWHRSWRFQRVLGNFSPPYALIVHTRGLRKRDLPKVAPRVRLKGRSASPQAIFLFPVILPGLCSQGKPWAKTPQLYEKRRLRKHVPWNWRRSTPLPTQSFNYDLAEACRTLTHSRASSKAQTEGTASGKPSLTSDNSGPSYVLQCPLSEA